MFKIQCVFKTEAAEDLLFQNLGILPETAIIVFLGFSAWYAVMFLSVLIYIVYKTNWTLQMDFTLYGRPIKVRLYYCFAWAS